jgi:phage FluMu protein Com
MVETIPNLKSIPCGNKHCDNPQIVQSNCTKLAFRIGDFISEIEFKKARYIEVRCGKCKEITLVRNPKFQYWK